MWYCAHLGILLASTVAFCCVTMHSGMIGRDCFFYVSKQAVNVHHRSKAVKLKEEEEFDTHMGKAPLAPAPVAHHL